MKNKIVISVSVIIIFIAIQFLAYFYGYVIFGKENWNAMDINLKLSILKYSQIALVFFVTFILLKKLPFEALGLKKDLLKGLLYGFIFVLPMFIGYGIQNNFHAEFSISLFHKDIVLAGFFEEFTFRGFLFGILFYYCGWGFITAVLIPSVLFGMGHLYQAGDLAESISVFLFTALGGAGFAWLYMAWGSLWMVIFLHGFMDLAWDMFSTQSGNVTGNLYANIFRFTTLGLAIYFTRKKAKAENRLSLKGRLWVNKEVV